MLPYFPILGTIQDGTKICTESHVPTPRYGQYLMHAHNHITPSVVAMDSCFALIGAYQHGIAVKSMSGGACVSTTLNC